jgi:SulP family sulfate permease
MKTFHEFIPKLFSILKSGYSFKTFRKDLVAGLTVGIIAIPLAMAFSIASGTTPDRGFATAIVAGFLISALGGSRVQIGGPTGAFVVIVYDIIQRTGYEGLAVSTLIAAALLILFGLFRLGTWIRFVPRPLITGFTTGIACLIFSSQIKDFFGLQIDLLPSDFLNKWILYFENFSTFHPVTLLLSASTLILMIFLRKFFPKIPSGICAIIFASTLVWFFQLPVDTIQSKFGTISSHLPSPSFPSLHILQDRFSEIFRDAITIALLGAIESLLSAVIADQMTGFRHKSNSELIGQGIANFASILFGGIPATGAIARTAANIKSGAETPISGIIHAATLFTAVFFFSSLVSQIPLACLAAILILIAWNMSEIHYFLQFFKAPKGDIAVLMTAFLLTLFVDITMAIFCGMILSSFLFMKKQGEQSHVVFLPRADNIEIYTMQGPFFFGSANLLKDLNIQGKKAFILRLHNVSTIDASGMCALLEFHQKCHKENVALLLSEIQDRNKAHLKKFGLIDRIEEKNIFEEIDAAVFRAHQL